jgi:hypothetical protein
MRFVSFGGVFTGEVTTLSRFTGKKLPPHWVYVPARKEVRDLLRSLGADVFRVEFAGTGGGTGRVGLSLGYLEHRVVDGAWRFYLRLWGVPQSNVEGQRDELAQAALHAIRQSVARCLAVPTATALKPTQLYLLFELGPNGVIPKCRVDPVDQYSFSAGCWWASPPAAKR